MGSYLYVSLGVNLCYLRVNWVGNWTVSVAHMVISFVPYCCMAVCGTGRRAIMRVGVNVSNNLGVIVQSWRTFEAFIPDFAGLPKATLITCLLQQ